MKLNNRYFYDKGDGKWQRNWSIETFIGGYRTLWHGGWTIGTLLRVLESLGSIENLRISNVMNVLNRSVHDERIKELFEEAFEIIDKKFPKNSTDFKIKVA